MIKQIKGDLYFIIKETENFYLSIKLSARTKIFNIINKTNKTLYFQFEDRKYNFHCDKNSIYSFTFEKRNLECMNIIDLIMNDKFSIS